MESACLYDADTIDANIGLPAFVRNIYIHHHYYDQRRTPDSPSIATVLHERPLEYLAPYIRENLPQWAHGKRKDFVPRLLTAAGRELGDQRIDRLLRHFSWLSNELDVFAERPDHTGIDVVVHYDPPTTRVWKKRRAISPRCGLKMAPVPNLCLYRRDSQGDCRLV